MAQEMKQKRITPINTEAPPLEARRLPDAVEAVLFVSPGPVSLARLAYALGVEEAIAHRAVTELSARYERQKRGLAIVRLADGYQMCTHPDFLDYVIRILETAPARLSRAALETLSIIAYRQPITLPEIEAIRGVDSAGVVRTLLERGLIEEAGRKDTVGRPILYATTEEFLVYFGLKDLSELPSLDQLPKEGSME